MLGLYQGAIDDHDDIDMLNQVQDYDFNDLFNEWYGEKCVVNAPVDIDDEINESNISQLILNGFKL